MMRELFDRANMKLRENLGDAAGVMTTIMKNPEMDPKLRLDAAKWLMERVMGKSPDVSISMDERTFERLFDRLDRGAGGVIDGEVVMMEGYEP